MLDLNRRGEGKGKVVLGIVVVLLLIGGIFAYYIFGNFNRSEGSTGRTLENPTSNLTNEEAVLRFDESFVRYLLYSIGASRLHNPPLSKNKPKVEFYIDDDIYSAVVEKGVISVERGGIEDEDIIIRTSTLEAVKMVRTGNYISESFSSGKSEMELISGKIELGSKGYLKIYNSLTGESS